MLKEELNNLLEVSEKTAAEQCVTNDLWQQRRGEIATFRYVLGVESQVRYQLDNMDDMVFEDELDPDADGNVLEE